MNKLLFLKLFAESYELEQKFGDCTISRDIQLELREYFMFVSEHLLNQEHSQSIQGYNIDEE